MKVMKREKRSEVLGSNEGIDPLKSLSEFGRSSKSYSAKKELAVISTSVMGVTWGLCGY